MLYDFGLGGVGQINPQPVTTAGLTPYSSPPPPQLPAPTAVPPKIPSVVNPYEAEQIRLINEQRKLLDQYSQIPQPEIKYQSPMNPLAAALISFGAGTLAHGGNSSEAIGSGINSGFNTYLGLKQANQEGENKTSQANYANQVNRLKAIMGGLEEMSAGYGGLSKDQAERAKAAALVGADVYGTQVKQDAERARMALELYNAPSTVAYKEALARQANAAADPNSPGNKAFRAQADLAYKQQLLALQEDKFKAQLDQQINEFRASAAGKSDLQLRVEAGTLAGNLKNLPMGWTLENAQDYFYKLGTDARDLAVQLNNPGTPAPNPGLAPRPSHTPNPVSPLLTLP